MVPSIAAAGRAFRGPAAHVGEWCSVPSSRDNFIGAVRAAELLTVLEREPGRAYSLTEVVAALAESRVAPASVFSSLMGLVARGEVELRLVPTPAGAEQYFVRKSGPAGTP